MDPLEIMPAEAWLGVIRNLNTLRDKQAAYNTCKLWRGLLQEKRTVWMFEGIFPLLIKYLPKSDILELRLVCKVWKAAIDSHLENDQPTIVGPGRYLPFTQDLPISTLGVCFTTKANRLGLQPVEVLLRFQSQFETEQASTYNPFVSRSMYLDACITDMNVAMTIERFLEKFGVHLYSLQLYVWQSRPHGIITPLHIAAFIFDILTYVPNLRKLDLKAGRNFNGQRTACLFCNMDTRELVPYLIGKAAPPLPHLTNLQLDVEPLIRQALESAYAPQLETYAHVSIQNRSPINLNTSIATEEWTQTFLCPLVHLGVFKRGFPLQRVHINMKQCERRQWHDMLYKTVENFQSSLTHLSIRWDSLSDAHLPKQLDMPLLQELFFEIGCWHSPQNLNFSFLQNLKSIRKVSCAFRKLGFERLLGFYKKNEKPKHQRMEGSVDLQYHLYDDLNGGPCKSNVWQLVPSLDRLEIHVAYYQHPRLITMYKFYTRGQKDKKGLE